MEGSGHRTRCLCDAHGAGLDVGGGLCVLAAREHDDIGLRLPCQASAWCLAGGVLVALHRAAVGRHLDLEAQVQGGAAVAAVEHDPEAAAGGQVLHEEAVELVVHDLAGALEVAGDEGVVLAAALVAVRVALPAAVAAVVQEHLVAGRGALGEPAEGGEHVGPRGQGVRVVVAQPADLRVLEVEGLLQHGDHGVRVVDAAREAAVPGLQAEVVDAHGQGLAHRRPQRPRRRGLRALALGHEAAREVQEVLRGELRHLREALGAQEAPHLREERVVRGVLAPGDHGAEGRGHGAGGLGVAGGARADVRAGLVVLAAGDHHDVGLRGPRQLVRQLLLDVHEVAVAQLHLVGQVQGRAAVAAVQDHGEAHARGQPGHQRAPQLVVREHARGLVVAGHQRLVLAVHLVPVLVRLLAAVAAVVEEDVVPGLRAAREPLQRHEDVLPRGHRARRVVAELPDVRDGVAELLLQERDEGVRVVDAARQLAAQAQVVDAHGHSALLAPGGCDPRRCSCACERRRRRWHQGGGLDQGCRCGTAGRWWSRLGFAFRVFRGVFNEGAVQPQKLLGAHLGHLLVAVPLEEVSHGQKQVLA
mmetsp:Transcript_79699/g.178276  ORF Transcript_79699/g.178276 Transcript_79699/m.178276 type:complete len:587 (+) Transcript_79699:289-2049(+)